MREISLSCIRWGTGFLLIGLWTGPPLTTPPSDVRG